MHQEEAGGSQVWWETVLQYESTTGPQTQCSVTRKTTKQQTKTLYTIKAESQVSTNTNLQQTKGKHSSLVTSYS